MGYNQENFRRIRAEYENKALYAERAADARREELHEKIPGLRELDAELSTFGLRMMKLAHERDAAGLRLPGGLLPPALCLRKMP